MRRFLLVPPVYFLIAAGICVLLDRTVPLARFYGAPWHWLGLILVLPAVRLSGSGARTLSHRGTTLNPSGQPTVLVTEGPFRFTRNPLYLSLALLLLGTAIFLGSLTPFFVIPVFIWTINGSFIRREEAKLSAAFGDEYRDYCRRVRRWL